MLRNKPAFGSGKDAQMIGIDALSFLALDQNLAQRFLDLSGVQPDQIRHSAHDPAFYVGLLDFILAHEPTLEAFASAASLEPLDVGRARDKLAGEGLS